LLCGASGGGHLYLLGPSGLALAACQGSRAAGELDAFAHGFMARAQHVADEATEVEHVTSLPEAPADAPGPRVLPVLLGCTLQGSHVHAGVLLLTSEPNIPLQAAGAVLEALAERLIQAGDVQPQVPETRAL
jgi:hypothetical protein